MAAELIWLTPTSALVGVAAVVPLAALLLAWRRGGEARHLLDLPPPAHRRRLGTLALVMVVPALLAVAAAQPALRTVDATPIRTDAAAMIVFDTSRSMLAERAAGEPTRLDRAKEAALRIRSALAGVPAGVAVMTDRVVPDLLPNPDPPVFAATVGRAVSVDEPLPQSESVTATDLDALGALGTGDYFAPSAKKRLVVVLTDGESRPFDAGAVGRALRAGPGEQLVVVHVGNPGEAVYDGGRPEQGYHADPRSGELLSTLATAARGAVFSEDDLAGAIARARADLGSGPTAAHIRSEHTRPLAPFAVAAAIASLAGLTLAWLYRRRAPADRPAAREPRRGRAAFDLRRPGTR